MTITFTIPANQSDPNGNPIPYERSTQRTFWNQRDRRYHAWKDYVRYHFNVAMTKLPHPDESKSKLVVFHTGPTQEKPIELLPDVKARMDIFVTYKHNAHADTDNVWKGIADSLFKNDKNVIGSFDFVVIDRCIPNVKVEITIPEEKNDL